ncbi:MAG: prenyltransferase/squalene oxidase repeat-containing protein [Gemmataceae bacterium]
MIRLWIACALTGSLFLPAVQAQTPEEKKETIAYLQALQTDGGGFRPAARATEAGLRATSSCLRALHYFGGEARNLDACKKYVSSCWNARVGGFADTPGGTPDVIVTAVGLMALVELKLSTAPYEKPAIAYLTNHARAFEQVRMAAAGLEAIRSHSPKNKEWRDALLAVQNADGTFGRDQARIRETGSVVACFLRLGGEIKHPEGIIKALDAGQREDGGFGAADQRGADLETSYRVVRTYVMLKKRPSKPDALRSFIARCRNLDGGYGVRPGEASSAGGTYFAGILLHWLDHP